MCEDKCKNQVDIDPTQIEREREKLWQAAISSLFFPCSDCRMCVYVYIYVYVVVCPRLARFFYIKLCACPFAVAAILWHIVIEHNEREKSSFVLLFFHQSMMLILVDNNDVTRAKYIANNRTFSLLYSQEKTTTKVTSIILWIE